MKRPLRISCSSVELAAVMYPAPQTRSDLLGGRENSTWVQSRATTCNGCSPFFRCYVEKGSPAMASKSLQFYNIANVSVVGPCSLPLSDPPNCDRFSVLTILGHYYRKPACNSDSSSSSLKSPALQPFSSISSLYRALSIRGLSPLQP